MMDILKQRMMSGLDIDGRPFEPYTSEDIADQIERATEAELRRLERMAKRPAQRKKQAYHWKKYRLRRKRHE